MRVDVVASGLIFVYCLFFPVGEALGNEGLIGAGNKAAGLAFLAAPLLLVLRSSKFYFPLSSWLLVVVLGLTICTVLINDAGGEQFGGGVRFALGAVFYFSVVNCCRTPATMFWALRGYSIGVLVLVVGFLGNVQAGLTYDGLSNRYSTFGTDPNNFAFMVVLAGWALAALPEFGGRVKVLIWVSVVVCCAFTGSRSGFALSLGSFSLWAIRTYGLSWSAIGLLVSLLGAAWWGADIFSGMRGAAEGAIIRVFGLGVSGFTDDERFRVWAAAVELFSNAPWFGAGLGAVFERTGLQTHNVFLYYFVELGVVAGLVWIVFFGLHFFYLYRIKRCNDRDLVFCLMGALLVLAASFMVLNWEYRKPVFLFTALCASGLAAISRERIR